MTKQVGCAIACAVLLVAVPTSIQGDDAALEHLFAARVGPFLKQHCVRCHNIDEAMSGVRVDHLDAGLDDRQIKTWEAVRKQIADEVMPPEDEPQPTAGQRQAMIGWIDTALNVARVRPRPKNGLVRRLTVAQYRNTLRDLLKIDDDLTEILPPDAVSRDGFLNNSQTLQLSPLLLEAYFQIADEALNRAIVDPSKKPSIQNFRMEFGSAINPEPCRDRLVLGALSVLLKNDDFVVTQPVPEKPFPFEPMRMRTKWRFIEGYIGNGTIREWRDFDSIYHAVFACMRGSVGYSKGEPFSISREGLLLRPAVPTDTYTYGPSANFKIALREFPNHGQFRVTVTAAKYDDGLLLEPGNKPKRKDAPRAVVWNNPKGPRSLLINEPGIYQVDVHTRLVELAKADASRLGEGLLGAWQMEGDAASSPERAALTGKPQEGVQFVDSPFGKSAMLNGQSVVVKYHPSLNVGTGDFTVAAWVHPKMTRQAGLVALGRYGPVPGWYLEMPDNQGILRFETFGPDAKPNGSIASAPATIVKDAWQHIAAVVRRAPAESNLYVNGFVVAKGKIAGADLDNRKADLHIGRVPGSQALFGMMDDVRLYGRALDESELQALIEPGRKFVTQREKPPELTLNLGERSFRA
ncbi:MAG TPA: LamG-like jellyroll fold domain-containing protein, partial [Pirellulales bacterium]|nr:LamG-like jellyroll fold domain-containing protein [Pirellulales bacterium]